MGQGARRAEADNEVAPRSRLGNGPVGTLKQSGGMAGQPHRLDGVCLDPADHIGVVDGREEYVGHSDRVGCTLGARQHRYGLFTEFQPLRLPGAQRLERLQRKVSGVNSARGNQCLRGIEHDSGIGFVADRCRNASMGGGEPEVADFVGKMTGEPGMQSTSDVGCDERTDGILEQVMVEIQLGAS